MRLIIVSISWKFFLFFIFINLNFNDMIMRHYYDDESIYFYSKILNMLSTERWWKLIDFSSLSVYFFYTVYVKLGIIEMKMTVMYICTRGGLRGITALCIKYFIIFYRCKM